MAGRAKKARNSRLLPSMMTSLGLLSIAYSRRCPATLAELCTAVISGGDFLGTHHRGNRGHREGKGHWSEDDWGGHQEVFSRTPSHLREVVSRFPSIQPHEVPQGPPPCASPASRRRCFAI